MSEPISRYPLQWPAGWKRTPAGKREHGQFARRLGSTAGSGYRPLEKITVSQAIVRLLGELQRMGVPEGEIIVSTHVRTRLDGLPYSGEKEPEDPGAAVYWRDHGQARCMAIDRYSKVAQNIAALAATIDAMRAIERHGGATILERAFTGFTALPAPIAAGMKRPWREVLRYANNIPVSEEAIKLNYRFLAREHHPDKEGGSVEKMAELNAARDEALLEAGS